MKLKTPWSKCEYYYTKCTISNANSQTCLNGGGWYCGYWRKYKEEDDNK